MTEYTGDECPIGEEKVVDFVVKHGGVPAEPTAVTITWKDSGGSVLETDTLAGGGVYRPDGSTSVNDPGHFRAKRTAGPTVAPGYTAYVQATIGASVGPTQILETYEVTASVITIETGGPYLVTTTMVKDALHNIQGIDGPLGLDDPRLLAIIQRNQSIILGLFGEDNVSDLSEQERLVAAQAIIDYCVADILMAVFPTVLEMTNVAANRRKFAEKNILAMLDDGLVASDQPGGKQRVSSRVL